MDLDELERLLREAKDAYPINASADRYIDTEGSERSRYGEALRQLDLALRNCAEELIRDARRYREVRRGQHWSVIDGIGDTLRAETLDAAVDALAQEGKG